MIDEGVKSYNRYRNEKKFQLALVYTIFSMVACVCFAVSYIAIGANFPAYIQFLGAFLFMILVGLLRQRKQALTRFIAIFTSMALILFQGVYAFGADFGFHYRVFPLTVVIFLLLDFNILYEKVLAYLISVIAILVFFVAINFQVPLMGSGYEAYGPIYKTINILLAFTTAMAILHYISVEIFSTKDQLYQMATRDALTGLFNRRTFIQKATTLFRTAQRGGNVFTIMIIDVDDFKSVNDQYGHVVGDRFLRDMASLFQKTLRETDFIARYGGEEFAIILHDAKTLQAQSVAEKLRQAVENFAIKEEGHDIQRTISIGLATYDHAFKDFHSILDKGDKAMYHSKVTGKNKVSTFSYEEDFH